jgi:hypothetical protein
VGPLADAAALVTTAMQAAYLRGDPDQAERLGALVHTIEWEAEVAGNIERGYAPVRPRRGPPGAVLGWYLHNDAHTRALRRARGLSVPEESTGVPGLSVPEESTGAPMVSGMAVEW